MALYASGMLNGVVLNSDFNLTCVVPLSRMSQALLQEDTGVCQAGSFGLSFEELVSWVSWLSQPVPYEHRC